jgi:hypothetical protein
MVSTRLPGFQPPEVEDSRKRNGEISDWVKTGGREGTQVSCWMPYLKQIRGSHG